MGYRPFVLFSVCLIGLSPLLLQRHPSLIAPRPPTVQAEVSPAVSKVRLVEVCGKLPLRLEANQGQTDSEVKFLSRGMGFQLVTADSLFEDGFLSLTIGSVMNSNCRQDSWNPRLRGLSI